MGPDYALEWHESLAERRKIAGLTRLATDIRLRIPETFAIHSRIVDWKRAYSPDGIPSQALGVDAMTLKIMRWTLAKRARTEIANRMGSPFFAGLQMDFLPGTVQRRLFRLPLSRTAASRGRRELASCCGAGQAVQRFWLTTSKRGLVLQPCLATLAFAHYGVERHAFYGRTSRTPQGAAAGATGGARPGRPANHFLCRPHRLSPSRQAGKPLLAAAACPIGQRRADPVQLAN